MNKSYIPTCYEELIKVFGNPTFEDPNGENKTIEWKVEWNNKTFIISDENSVGYEYSKKHLTMWVITLQHDDDEFVHYLFKTLLGK